MNSLRDVGIDVVPVTGGFRYSLPRRTGKPIRVMGGILAGFGGLATVFMVGWMSGPIRSAFGSSGGIQWFSLVFGLLGLGGLIPGLGTLFAGLGALAGRSRCDVVVADQRIRLTERFGLVRWTWTRNLADLSGLCLSIHNLSASAANPNARAALAQPTLGSIATVSSKSGLPPLQIGVGYPKTVLQALAHELAGLTRLPLTSGSGGDPEAMNNGAADRAEDLRAAEQPPKTDIVVQTLANGVGISVPPAGLVHGSKGLFVFAIIWLVFCSLIFGFMLVATLKGKSSDNAPVPVFLFAGVFVAIGVGMLMGAISMGKRRALIAVADGVLTIRQIGIRKTREWRFDRGEVAAVRMGPSGMEVNNKPVMELQILGKAEAKKTGLLSQRRDDELQWLAAVLRQALNVRSEPPSNEC